MFLLFIFGATFSIGMSLLLHAAGKSMLQSLKQLKGQIEGSFPELGVEQLQAQDVLTARSPLKGVEMGKSQAWVLPSNQD